MEYNKKDFTKADDKKVLHKIRKHWVVVSTALLMTLGGAAAATTTHVSAHADANNNGNEVASKTDAVKEQLNQTLQQPKQQQPANSNITNNAPKASNTSTSNTSKSITDQAHNLYSDIMNGAIQNKGSNANAQNVRLNNFGQSQQKSGNGLAQRQDQNQAATAANNNQVVGNDQQRRPRTLLGASAPSPSSTTYLDNKHIFPSNGFKVDNNTNAVYAPYSDASDANPSDWGEVTVQYRDKNNKIIRSTTDGPAAGGTDFGNTSDPTTNNVKSLLSDIPEGYQLTEATPNDPYSAIDSGDKIGTFVNGENQFLVINVNSIPAATGPGHVLIQYEDASNNNKIISHHAQSDVNNSAFNMDQWTNNPPEGFKLVSDNSWNTKSDKDSGSNVGQNPITNFNGNQPQVLHIFVTPSSPYTTATINYVDASDGNTTVDTESVQGKVGSDFDMSQYTELLPSGYVYNGTKGTSDNGPKIQVNGRSIGTVYVKPSNQSIPSPKVINNYGPVVVKYYKDNGSGQPTGNVLNTLTFNGKVNTPFKSDVKKYIPDGYTFSKNLNPGLNYPSSPNKITSDTVLVNPDSSYKNGPVSGSYISYQLYDLKTQTVSDMPAPYNSMRIPLNGNPGTPINYTPFTTHVPNGYVYANRILNASAQLESNQNPIILLESISGNNDSSNGNKTGDNGIAQPITVHYINENGSDVSPANQKTLTGTYGQSYTVDDITGYDENNQPNASVTPLVPLPNGYTLTKGQNNQSYQIGANPYTVNILVHGTSINPNHQLTNQDTIYINQNISDGSGHQLAFNSDVAVVPIGGEAGQVITFDPSNYVPNPESNYTTPSTTKPQSVQIQPNGDLEFYSKDSNGTHLTKITTNSKDHNDITFNYTQKYATARILYEDASDDDALVGSDTIFGAPGTAMSTFYNGTNGHYQDQGPYGYNNGTPDPSNPSNLYNGNSYVIDVHNAHLQPQPPVSPRSGYGYITVEYGSGFGTSSPVVYSTIKTSGNNNSDFNVSDYTKSTTKGGQMPSVYSDAVDNVSGTSDGNVTNYQSDKPQTYYINVHRDQGNYGQLVADTVDYAQLNSDGSTTALPNDTRTIHGKSGYPVDYTPLINNIPNGYYYNGSQFYNSVFTSYNPSKPIATIYVTKAKAATSNRVPGYDPTADTTDTYDPWDNSDNAPLVPSDDPLHPVNGYDKKNHPFINKGYDSRSQNDKIPSDYAPAWVKNQQGKYVPGFVPANNIPNGYVPGEVPDGKGHYVPGYVPAADTNTISGTTNGTDKNGHKIIIPKYIDGPVKYVDKNGKTITIPGLVPNNGEFTNGSAGQITIHYVNAQNHADQIQQVTANGNVGTGAGDGLKLSDTNQYVVDVPSGYTFSSVLGRVNSDGTTTPAASDLYYFSDNPYDVDVAVSKNAIGDVVYETSDGTQVGSAHITGPEGRAVNFDKSGADHDFERLTPYGYQFDSTKQSSANNPSVLNNNGTYVIYVKSGGLRPALPQEPVKGYGTITVNYVNANNKSQVLGTEQFMGSDGSPVSHSDQSDVTKTEADGGYIPYGYMNATAYNDGPQDITNVSFKAQPTVLTYSVFPDSSTYGQNKHVSDQIEYEEVTKNGLVPVKTSDGQLDTFTIKGNAGDTIDYTPYENNVPYGYSYDGLGTHSNYFDSAHVGTNGKYDVVLVRKQTHKAVGLGTITVNYYIKNSDGQFIDQNGHATTKANAKADSIVMHSRQGKPFNLGYYQNNLPYKESGYTYSGISDGQDTYKFNNDKTDGAQSVDIDIAPVKSKATYGTITVHFVESNGSTPVPGATDEVLTGADQSLFSPQEYEYNTPADTEYKKLVGTSGDVNSYDASNPQTVTIAVTSTNGSF